MVQEHEGACEESENELGKDYKKEDELEAQGNI